MKFTKPRNLSRIAAACFTFVLLYGCGATQPPNALPLPVVQPTQSVDIDPSLVTYCPAVPHLPRQQYTQGKTLDPVKFWQDLYTECSGKQRKLVDLTSQAFKLNPAKPVVVAPYPPVTQ